MGADLSVAALSMASEVYHGYQLVSCVPDPPKAFRLFPQKKSEMRLKLPTARPRMRSAGGPPAAKLENAKENNQHAGSRTGKLWRYLSTTDDDKFCKRDGLCGRQPATV
ncbi:hypothetical protein MRX96_013344 [Rhipicephalus microplus]